MGRMKGGKPARREMSKRGGIGDAQMEKWFKKGGGGSS